MGVEIRGPSSGSAVLGILAPCVVFINILLSAFILLQLGILHFYLTSSGIHVGDFAN